MPLLDTVLLSTWIPLYQACHENSHVLSISKPMNSMLRKSNKQLLQLTYTVCLTLPFTKYSLHELKSSQAQLVSMMN